MSMFHRAVSVGTQGGVGGGAGGLNNPNVPITADQLAAMVGAGTRSAAGISVTEETATRQVTALACIRLIAETIASLPIGCYVKDGDRRRQVGDPRWLSQANDDQDLAEVVEDLLVGALGWGNGVAQLVRSDRNDVLQILPQVPRSMVPHRGDDGRLAWLSQAPGGGTTVWDRYNVLHVKGFRQPGTIWGVSPLTHHRQALGLAQAAEQFGSSFFGNGAHPGGVIETPDDLTKQQAEILLLTWNRDHGGVARANRPGLLSNGAKFNPVTIAPEDAQFLETRMYQDSEVARIYRCPPHLVGAVEKTTSWGTGIEEQGINFVVYTLRTWITKLERALTALQPRGQFIRINVDGLLRAKLEDRMKAYATGRQWGWLNADTILALEDMAALPDGAGQTYLSPLNMIDASDLTSRPLRDRAQAASFLALAGIADPDLIAAIVGLAPGDIGPLLPSAKLAARVKAAVDAIEPDDDEPSGPDPDPSEGEDDQ